MRRRRRRILGYALLGFLVAIVAVYVGTTQPGQPALYPARPDEATVTVYVLANAVHSNLAVRSDLLTARPGPTADAVAALRPTPWVYVGWGDEAFYQGTGWSPARVADLMRAFFKPGNPSVVHLAGTATPTIDASHPRIMRLTLSQRGFERMRARIDRAFALKDRKVQPFAPGHAPDSLFFRSGETFSILKVCNHWTAAVLNAAGVPSAALLDGSSAGLEWDLVRRGGATPIAQGSF